MEFIFPLIRRILTEQAVCDKIKYINAKGGRRVFYNENECCIELSAEELCALVSRSSDLDSPSPSKMNIHSKDFDVFLTQLPDHNRASEPLYLAQSFVNTTQSRGIYYTVNTVADRSRKEGSVGTVDRFVEMRSYDDGAYPSNYDIALVKCNAYFFAVKNLLGRVNARIIFCFKDTKKIKIVDDSFSTDELRKFYFELLERADFFGRMTVDRINEVLPSARKAPFPYSVIRDGQEEMVKSVYRGICKGKNVFVQAPTGIGKTISSLYPAIRTLGEGKCDKIFYLTAKASTRREAFSAMKRIFSAGAKVRSVIIGAKDSMCVCPKVRSSGLPASNFCNSFDCEFAKGYYDRVNGALEELLSNYNGFTQSLITTVACKHRVCPYELSLDLSRFCDVIICDYNYVFDPLIYFKRYFGQEVDEKKYVFLIDEAHNLADRAVDMYSALLCRNDFSTLAEELPPYEAGLIDALDTFVLNLSSAKKLCRDNMIKDEFGEERGYYISRNFSADIEKSVEKLYSVMNAWIRKNRISPHFNAVKTLFSKIQKYKSIMELYDERFVFFVEVFLGDIKIRLSCLDPSHLLSLCHKRAVSSVMFSATLEPLDYFCDILGGDRSSIRTQLSSPFRHENLCVIAVDSISTRFEDREKSYKKIASCIAGAVSGRAGNYIVFFPSYKYMEEVLCVFEKKYPYVKTVVQKNTMSYSEKEDFLSEFKEDSGILRVGFCVLGGSFSEGIDLPGTRLIGTVIVGVGLPGLSNERNIMKEYFDNTRERGYDYAYTYPGMNRVLQAAGRVIRTENDKGIVVLIDDRYATEQYKNMLPMQWSHIKYSPDAKNLAENVKNFWNFEGKTN